MLRKFNKGISILLSATFVLTMPVSAFAAPVAKDQFFVALEKTKTEVKRELALMEPYNAISVMNGIKMSPYELMKGFKYSVDYDGTTDNFSYGSTYMADKSLEKYAYNGKVSFDDRNHEMSVYVDNNISAINLPSVSDKYYYVEKNITEEDWNNSLIAQNLDISYKDYLSSTEEATQNLKIRSEIFTIPQFPENLAAKYCDIIKTNLDAGIFKLEGNDVVETSRGMISTNKISCTLKSTAADQLFNELADTVLTDQELAAYISATYEFLTEEDVTEAITSLSEGFSSLAKGNDITLCVYINNAGYSIRNELIVEEEKDTTTLALELLGHDYLLDETAFSIEVASSSETSATPAQVSDGIKFASIGNIIPENGVLSNVVTVESYSQYTDGAETAEYGSNMYIDYTWDISKPKDNLNVNFMYDDDLNNEFDDSPTTANINGTLIIDEKNGMVKVDFSDISLSNFGEDGTTSINFSLRNIDTSEIALLQNKSVNIMELTQEEIDSLLESLAFEVSTPEETAEPMEEEIPAEETEMITSEE